MSGIYIHIPFCSQACHYCDFHFSTNLQLKSDLLTSLVQEIQRSNFPETDEPIETVYLGGGTPSLLNEKELDLIFNALSARYDLSTVEEITIEANPEDVSSRSVQSWKEIGFNRISLGIQSFHPHILKWMNRAHSADQAIEALRTIQNQGITNISTDLIFGSVFHKHDVLGKDLTTLLEFDIPHVSTYNLTIEPKTAFGNWKQKGEILEQSDEEVIRQFEQIKNGLSKNGFDHYEISNFGKPGFYSKHNSNYWKNKSYAGFGPGAHAYDGNERRFNIANNAKYIACLNSKKQQYETETLRNTDKVNEHLLTRLRTIWGVDVKYIETYKKDFLKVKHNEIESHISRGNLVKKDHHLFLTSQAQAYVDSVTADLFL